jgi:dipeptide transport system permease protein
VLTCACCSLLVVAAIFGNWLAPYSKEAVSLGASLLPPAWEAGGTMAHLLGTDQLGRDILSRLIAGARISLATAAAATLVSGVFGVLVGLVAGYVGGVVESIAMRVVDAFLALPFILLALALVATLGTGFGNIIMVMVIANWGALRAARAAAKSCRSSNATSSRWRGSPACVRSSSCCGTSCPTC